MLSWFDQNPVRYEWFAGLALCGALALVARAVIGDKAVRRTGLDWAWALAILLVLLAGRWPGWVYPHEFNPDESVLLTGATTLRHDPVYWRSVEGGTAGPLDFYALLPMGSLLGQDHYLSARLTAWLLLSLALIATHQALVLVAGRAVARTAGFAALAFEALTQEANFFHYSTELVPVALLATGLLLAVRRFWAQADGRWNFAGGLALGAVPFAKLQAAPLGLLLGVLWIAGEFARRRDPALRRSLGALVAGALLPSLLCALALTLARQWPDARVRFLYYNIGYVADGRIDGGLLAEFWKFARGGHSLLPEWLAGTVLGLLLLSPFALRASNRRSGLLALAAAGMVAVGIFCIFTPGRPFLHYWQLLLVPLTFFLGICTGRAVEAAGGSRLRQLAFPAVVLLTGGGSVLAGWVGLPPRFLGPEARARAQSQDPVVPVLKKLTAPGEALALWGWMSAYYVEAGLSGATRDPHSGACILDHRFRDYFRTCYLAELRHSRPPVFIDVVGPRGFIFNQPGQRHEVAFPELGAYVRANYEFVLELEGSRIYVRRDRLAALLERAAAQRPQ